MTTSCLSEVGAPAILAGSLLVTLAACNGILGFDQGQPLAGQTTGGNGGRPPTGGSGGVGGASTCHASGLRDDFEGSTLDPMWDVGGNSYDCGVHNGIGYIQVPANTVAGEGAIYTRQRYDVTGCATLLEVQETPPPSAWAVTQFMLWIDDDNHARFAIEQGTLVYVVRVDGAPSGEGNVTYNATDHRWLQFRHDQDRFHLEVSPDGATWNRQLTVPAPQWLDAVQVSVSLTTWNTDTDDIGVEFDNLNQVP